MLAIIPVRAGSKRIPNKNIRNFCGFPLLSYPIKQAKQCSFINRIIVDTDSPKIAAIAKKYGAEVPYLRPAELAQDKSRVVDSILYLLKSLKSAEGYIPDYIIILQTTSPLREIKDIENCWEKMKKGGATTVLTVCETHPRFYHLDKNDNIILMNGSEKQSTNMQEWPKGYILNGCFVYVVKTAALLREKLVITKKTKAVICPKWRSVDLDMPEEWAMAELIYKNKKNMAARIKNFR